MPRGRGGTSRRSRPTPASSSRSSTSPTPTGSTGIPPAIAVAQRAARRSSRSTVGTVTEVHDYLGLLFAKLGQVVCIDCGATVEPASPVDRRAMDRGDCRRGPATMIAFPLDVRPESDRAALADGLREDGFVRVRIGGAGPRAGGRAGSPALARERHGRRGGRSPGPGLGVARAAARLDRDGVRQGAGALPGARRRRRPDVLRGLAVRRLRPRLMPSPSLGCSATTARSGRARRARGSAG